MANLANVSVIQRDTVLMCLPVINLFSCFLSTTYLPSHYLLFNTAFMALFIKPLKKPKQTYSAFGTT